MPHTLTFDPIGGGGGGGGGAVSKSSGSGAYIDGGGAQSAMAPAISVQPPTLTCPRRPPTLPQTSACAGIATTIGATVNPTTPAATASHALMLIA